MQKIHLESGMSDRLTLDFVGELLSQVSSEKDTTERGTRHYELSVFRTEERLFVGAIFFRSTVEGEVGGSLAETLDSEKDVEDFFFAFEPDELVDKGMRSRLGAEDLADLLRRLYEHYEAAVQLLVSQLAEYRTTPARSE